MKTNKIISLLVAMAVMMIFTVSALALTLAGTQINNQAVVTYQNNTGVVTFTSNSNIVTTTVTQVAAVVVSANSGNVTVLPGSQAVNWFVITNNGNNADKFNFAAPTLGGTLAASATLAGVYVNPVLTAASSTFAGTGTATALVPTAGVYQTPFINSTPASTSAGVLYPNGTVIFVVYNIPNAAVNGDTLIKTTTASSVFDPTKTSTTTVAGVNMNDTVSAGVLTVTKQVRNVTTAGAFASTAVGAPGNTLEYQITVTNTGTATAQAVVLSDAIDANTTYVAASDVFGGGAVGTSQTATLIPGYSATNRIYSLGATATSSVGGTIPAAGVVTVTFRVTIN